jgi:phage/plasmid-associated DNA primase
MKCETTQKTSAFNNRDIALLFHRAIPNRVVTVKEQTYYYTGVVWEKCDKTFSRVQLCLSNDFIKHIDKYRNIWGNIIIKELDNETDTEKQKLIREKHNNMLLACSETIKKLYDNEKRKPFVKEIILLSNNDKIVFDEKTYLYAFNNCVFDLRTFEKITPNPTDYMTVCTGYDYDDNYDTTRITELEKLIKGIHPIKNVYNYFLSVLSTSFTGHHLQKFVILTGEGRNGKGLIMKLLNSALGQYSYMMPVSLLTTDIKQGSNPEVNNMSNKRLCISVEPKHAVSIRMDNVKTITGEQELNARALYSSDTRVFMRNTLIMQANKIPKLDETGYAVFDRLIIIPFITTAVPKKDYDEATDKKYLTILNTEYDDDEWRNKYKQALFCICKNYILDFYKNKQQLPSMPEECVKATTEHLAFSDDIHLWFSDLYVEDADNYEVLKLKDLYNLIKESSAFLDLSKNEKRSFSYKVFCDKIRENRQLRKYVVEDKMRYKSKGDKMSGVCLCGWRKKTDEDENKPENDDTTDEEEYEEEP